MNPWEVTDTYGLTLFGAQNLTQLDYETQAFKLRLSTADGGLGAHEHLLNMMRLLWPADCKSPFYIIENVPVFAKEFCENRILCIMGNASSSKTSFYSRAAICLWLCDPMLNKVIVVSVDIVGAKNRIWGQVVEAFHGAVAKLPGKVLKTGKILPIDPETGKPADVMSGIELVAGHPSKEEQAKSKIQGYKVGTGEFLLIVDEATKVAQGISETFIGNNMSNPKSRMGMLANFDSANDPFGKMVEPIDGWDTVDPDTGVWDSKRGARVVHVDGLKSTNWLNREDIYPFLQSWTHIQHFIDHGEENTAEWWKNVRSFWSPTAVGRKGYYEFGVIMEMGALSTIDNLKIEGKPEIFAGLDQSYTADGDDAVIYPIRVCNMVDGSTLIDFGMEPTKLRIDASNKKRSGSYQICDQVKRYIEEHGIIPMNLGFDGTSPAFSDLIQTEVSQQCVPITSAGAPSTARTGALGPKGQIPHINSRRFASRVAEVWCTPYDFMRAGVIRGLRGAAQTQAIARLVLPSKVSSTNDTLIAIETKDDMKKRMRRASPNEFDALCIALQVAIRRMSLAAYKMQEGKKNKVVEIIDPLVAFLNNPHNKRFGKTGSRVLHINQPNTSKNNLTSLSSGGKVPLMKRFFPNQPK